MPSVSVLTIAASLLSSVALSAPISKLRSVHRRDAFSSLIASLTPSSGTTPVTVSQTDETTLGIVNAAALASSAYCPVVTAGNWTCPTCATVPDLQLLYTGGDGSDVPRVFVGFSPAMNAIVVSHEGSERNLDAWINNLEADLVDPDPSLTSASGVEVHGGFQDMWLNTSTAVAGAVNSALSGVGADASFVLFTGHSKGAAASLFDAISLRQQLPQSVNMQVITFGQPRIGNPAWSTLAASVLGDSFIHVTNDNDIVPRLPGTFLGYEQTITELWINGSGDLELCPGLENDACSAGVSDFDLSTTPHDGPYLGITMNRC